LVAVVLYTDNAYFFHLVLLIEQVSHPVPLLHPAGKNMKLVTYIWNRGLNYAMPKSFIIFRLSLKNVIEN